MTSHDLLEETVSLSPSNIHLDHSLQVPIRKEILSYLLSLPPSTAATIFSPQSTPLLLITPLIRTIACFSTMLLTDIRWINHRIMLPLPDDNLHHDTDLAMYISRRLCRTLEVHRYLMEDNMRIIRIRAPHLADELGTDNEFLSADISLLLTRLENDVQFLASMLSTEQAKLVNILAKVGILFVPVTTVAAVLSIQGPRSRFVIFGAVAIPVLVVFSLWLLIINKRKPKIRR